MQIELDESDERNVNKRYATQSPQNSAQTQKPKAPPPTFVATPGASTNAAQTNASRPLPRCHFCPERGTVHPATDRAVAAALVRNSSVAINYLRICVNGVETSALVDSAASDCFIRSKYVSADIPRIDCEYLVHTASKNKIMRVNSACDLPVKIAGQTDYVRFLMSDELASDVTLGRTWLKSENTVHDHALDCLYIGKDSRRRVYLTRDNSLPLERIEPPFNFFDKVKHGFSGDLATKLKDLLGGYSDVLFGTGPLRQMPYVMHDIELTDDKPFRLAPYRYSVEKKRAIREQVKEMLADGLIEHSSSAYSSPIVMHGKKDGCYRFCNDFRRLNALTKSRAQVLPIIQEVIKDIGSAKVFSTLDLKSGYWQIRLTDRAKPFTAFTTPDGGLYQWRVMSFGLKNAPGCFNDFISQEVLSGFVDRFVKSYLDDFIIYSDSWEEHLMHLSLVFERLRVYGLTCTVDKCYFGLTNLEFLGYQITEGENQPKSEHVSAILKASVPQNRRDLRKFFGPCGWLREYIPDYARIAAPLTALLSPSCAWYWTETEQQAFDAIKHAFSKPLVLCRPKPEKRFYLQTDACATGMGAVLYQHGDKGERRIIAHATAKFTKVEKRYHSNEQECLAVIWALRRYSHYLEDGKFTLRTDNRALTWLDKTKDGRGKLHRWAMYLRSYNFDIEHVAGKDNELPDALSRDPGDEIYVDNGEAFDALLPPERLAPTQEAHIASAIAQDLRARIIEEQAGESINLKDTAPWETVAIDFMGPYPRTARGKRFILVVIDTMSRWVEAFGVSNSVLRP